MIRIKVQYMEEEIKNYIDYLTFERRNAKNTYNSYKSDLEEYRLYLKQRHIALLLFNVAPWLSLDYKDMIKTFVFHKLYRY